MCVHRRAKHHTAEECEAFWIPRELRRSLRELRRAYAAMAMHSDTEKTRAEDNRAASRWNGTESCLMCTRCVSVMLGARDPNADEAYDRRKWSELYRYVQTRYDPAAMRSAYIRTLELETGMTCTINSNHAVHVYGCVDYDLGVMNENTLTTYTERRRLFLDCDPIWTVFIMRYETCINALRRLMDCDDDAPTLEETEFALE